jgi:hypothetical protein
MKTRLRAAVVAVSMISATVATVAAAGGAQAAPPKTNLTSPFQWVCMNSHTEMINDHVIIFPLSIKLTRKGYPLSKFQYLC